MSSSDDSERGETFFGVTWIDKDIGIIFLNRVAYPTDQVQCIRFEEVPEDSADYKYDARAKIILWVRNPSGEGVEGRTDVPTSVRPCYFSDKTLALRMFTRISAQLLKHGTNSAGMFLCKQFSVFRKSCWIFKHDTVLLCDEPGDYRVTSGCMYSLGDYAVVRERMPSVSHTDTSVSVLFQVEIENFARDRFATPVRFTHDSGELVFPSVEESRKAFVEFMKFMLQRNAHHVRRDD